MENRDKNIDRDYTGRGEYNQRLGRELNQRDHNQNSPRQHHRGHTDIKWDEGNHFHTGPSERGAQDRDRNMTDNRYNSDSAGSYNQGQGRGSQQEHYGSRKDSPYRNERSYLDHGNSSSSQRGSSSHNQNWRDGSASGNFNEQPDSRDNIHTEGPGSRSRYKESDYRYGSGSHNWYREGRYTPDEDRSRHDDRGFFERTGDKLKNTWNDIMHSDDPDYQRRHQQPHHEKGSDRVRMGSEPYRNRQFDKGYESGPRWADETDTGHDNQYNDSNQRYRR